MQGILAVVRVVAVFESIIEVIKHEVHVEDAAGGTGGGLSVRWGCS